MVKPDSKATSEAQKAAQEQLRLLLEASANYDRIDALGGAGKLGEAELLQQATAERAAMKRGIEILTAANSDAECEEAVRLVGDILAQCERGQATRPLQ